ncbi:TonB-dependent receptor plug domain-containing protein [Halochromatium salexigens]|uniref:TonB-dependent receptor plug domain-containing protein n=1 Tax=Halochromatium salexigens TaxID=49447 RepID=UPI0023EF3BA7|nr:TonB-dependent receptor [Halochromatium salexigens]
MSPFQVALVYANPQSDDAATDADQAPLQDLLSLLEQETELATRSGMNADYVPGMATILSGEDLLVRGVRNVGEALTLVPGISDGMEMSGERQILSRGVGFGYASGNIKILLDGVSMNSTLYATANPVLNIPIEQVERIEVIRGPGASVHGEYAFAGVVDVITRKSQRKLHVQAMEGSGDRGGGGQWYWHDRERDLSVSFNVLGLDGDAGVDVAEDALYGIDRPELSNAPGTSNESHRYRGLFADVTWGDVFAAVKILDDDYGDAFGINHFLPPEGDRLSSRQGYESLQLGGNLQLGERLRTQLRLEALRHNRDRNELYVAPAGYLLENQPVYMSQDYRETRYLAAADLHWQPHPRHELFVGLEARHVQVDEATWDWPEAFAIDVPWLDEDLSRRVLSVVVQDQIRIGERLNLTAALRFDEYSDVGMHLSPRLAAVWPINDEHILKLQYARAFRPPTFYELTYPGEGTDEVRAGEIATYEFGYILKKPRWEGRLILFQSDLSDSIVFGYDEEGYINSADVRLRGIEVEYTQRLLPALKLDANLSYVESVDLGLDQQPLPGGTDLLGNLALLWQPIHAWTAALQLRYVGERARRPSDTRSPVDAYTLADLTLSYATSDRGLFAHIGVKNLTDADVRFPEQPSGLGGVDLVYRKDYPRPGRRWWLSIGYAF